MLSFNIYHQSRYRCLAAWRRTTEWVLLQLANNATPSQRRTNDCSETGQDDKKTERPSDKETELLLSDFLSDCVYRATCYLIATRYLVTCYNGAHKA